MLWLLRTSWHYFWLAKSLCSGANTFLHLLIGSGGPTPEVASDLRAWWKEKTSFRTGLFGISALTRFSILATQRVVPRPTVLMSPGSWSEISCLRTYCRNKWVTTCISTQIPGHFMNSQVGDDFILECLGSIHPLIKWPGLWSHWFFPAGPVPS